MREIKFRAWHGRGKRMILWDELLSSYTVDSIFKNYEKYSLNLMQFTGLKDKNGKEIYEGDIVLFGGINGKLVCKYYKGKGAFVFEWINSNQYTLVEYLRKNQDDNSNIDVEIIGNIYENPELLK